MQSADLNLTTNVTGHQRFLFIKLPSGDADAGLAKDIGLLGDGMENMHYADGPPSVEAFPARTVSDSEGGAGHEPGAGTVTPGNDGC